jgi:hypothetical protein
MEDLSEQFDARIKRGFGMICVGPPMSGKTYFTTRLLQNASRLIDKPFDYIVWFYGQQTNTVAQLQREGKTKTVAGLPENLSEYIQATDPMNGSPRHGLLIFDDLMQSVSSSEEITRLCSNRCQHENVSWIVMMQNLFHQGKSRLTMLRCAHYLVLFNNPLDQSAGHHLAKRISPGNPSAFIRIFEAATRKPNGYLFIDGHQKTPPSARFRTDIFHEEHQRTFVVTDKRRK